MNRRNYLKGVAGAAGIVTVSHTGTAQEWSDGRPGNGKGLPNEMPPRKGESVIGLTDQIDTVKAGIIGLGNRGSSMTQLIDAMYPDKGEIRAICDIREEAVESMYSWIDEEGENDAENVDTYSGSKNSWKKLVQRDDLDLVFVFTHHQAHTPMAEYAMKKGKHVAVEVPAATSIEECWTLVDTAEQTQQQCLMLENVCYFDEELWITNMVQEGVFGDQLNYASGGYIHNLVSDYFFQAYWNDWRAKNHLQYKGDLYPTHGLGPIAFYMGLNRGDRMEYIASQESPESRLTQRAQELPEDHWAHGIDDWANGDTTRSEIMTNQGRQIHLQFDVKTNRGYSRKNELAGSEAYHEGYPSQLALNGEGHGFVDDDTYDDYYEEYRHPLWKEMEEIAEEYGGHGGGDFLEIYRLFDAFNEGRPLDMDVYDAAAWSAVRPLSAISIEHGGKPVKFPDFTRGAWEEERELQIMDFDTI
ncbi:Gfo/Idh/MocA family protein [Halopiger aswanensis]|uniref:Putative dehydrogenase n=1 Tax=Halopiger aswanensis TaxID=148449 RepID=A0A3R7DWG4_9EURY|nr:Gfo/Idh/MocA family oxidoreductase [Halopiger aswanensis]RKD86295.1 putative dehydrogenase [Halopiger aswanensis]